MRLRKKNNLNSYCKLTHHETQYIDYIYEILAKLVFGSR